MRVAATPAISKFLIDNSTIYPYNKLRPTRNSFYCKWVMLRGYDRASTESFPVLANSFTNGVLIELLLSEKGIPVPPELSDIMDSMYWWGKHKNLMWFDCVTHMMAEAMENDIEDDMKELKRAMISVQIKEEIHAYFTAGSVAAELLWLDWLVWFNHNYKAGPKSFHAMCLYCFEYVHWSIAQVNY